jgi:hypothetical protein
MMTASCSRKNVTHRLRATALLLFSWLIVADATAAGPGLEPAADQTATEKSLPTRLKNLDTRFGGRFKITGAISWPDADSIFEPVGTGTAYDGSVDLRVTNDTFFSEQTFLETHYEAILVGGDTRQKLSELEAVFPDLSDNLRRGARLDDDRRLMDLTDTLRDRDSYRLLQRLDRLNLGINSDWGSLRIGRQAITWGNGLIFNPMDLFNPFAPTEVDRDYKAGDDLISAQVYLPRASELQVLNVIRRNPDTGDVSANESSFAAKWHLAGGTTEYDLMAARHYEDYVFGAGSRGYLADAAWRIDATWTDLTDPGEGSPGGYLSLVANMDYSWVWWGKNFYGLGEFYYNGLGENDYEDAFDNKDLIERQARGELFVLGRYYFSSTVQVELHPLVQFYFTAINNIKDPSGILQPRATWDMTQNLQATLGANLYYGAPDTEFGGILIPGTTIRARPVDSLYLWLTYYF